MPTLDVSQKLSQKILWYLLFRSLIGYTIFGILLAVFLPGWLPALSNYRATIFLLVLGIALVYRFLWWKMFTYTIGRDYISIFSGVIFGQTKVVNFNDIENINSTYGPLLGIFGLRRVIGFTSSPGQLVITRSSSGSHTQHRPDVDLIVETNLAQELSELVRQGDIQKVQNVTS